MSWFSDLVGFDESAQDVRRHLSIDDERIVSSANGRTFGCGRLTTPSVADLRSGTPTTTGSTSGIRIQEVVADVRDLHTDPANAGAVFQVASQFNLLEMPSPDVTPEAGVTGYAYDRTQGPVCAMACGAATIQRNWFAPVGDQIGQTADRQIDCLADLGRELARQIGCEIDDLWEMRNGYCLATGNGLREIGTLLRNASDDERDRLLGLLRVGLHERAEVTADAAGHDVTQVFCSAVPVGYSPHSADEWEPLARLVLDATYEATFRLAAWQAAGGGSDKLFLTLVGGGVFGNRIEWILDAIRRASGIVDTPLDVTVVSYGSPTPGVAELAEGL